MQNSFRWYGPNDPVKLTDIRQSNAEYIVTSLHQIPYGEKWNKNDIKKRINYINANIFSRLFAEWKLRKQSSKYDVILCFSNLPPLLKLDSKVVLFLQNKLLISNNDIIVST